MALGGLGSHQLSQSLATPGKPSLGKPQVKPRPAQTPIPNQEPATQSKISKYGEDKAWAAPQNNALGQGPPMTSQKPILYPCIPIAPHCMRPGGRSEAI